MRQVLRWIAYEFFILCLGCSSYQRVYDIITCTGLRGINIGRICKNKNEMNVTKAVLKYTHTRTGGTERERRRRERN